MYVCVYSGDGVWGARPRAALWAPCTKDLSVLPSGIWLSVWAVPQSAGHRAQPAALSHARPQTHRAHLTIAHALQQPCLDRIMTRSRGLAHHRRPGKADLSLSWITDIHTASCSQNNLISVTLSARVYNKTRVFASEISLTRSDSLTDEIHNRGSSAARSHAFKPHCWCTLRGGRKVKEKSPSSQVAAITHALFMPWKWTRAAFTGF